MNATFDRQEQEEKLGAFLAGYPDEYDDFLDQAHAEGYALNSELTSLEDLERYLLYRKATHDPNGPAAAFDVYVGAWYHLGEVVKKHFGGYWAVSEEDPAPGRWVIKDFRTARGRQHAEFDTKRLVRSFIRRPSEGVFRRAIAADTDPNFFAESQARRAAAVDPEASE